MGSAEKCLKGEYTGPILPATSHFRDGQHKGTDPCEWVLLISHYLEWNKIIVQLFRCLSLYASLSPNPRHLIAYDCPLQSESFSFSSIHLNWPRPAMNYSSITQARKVLGLGHQDNARKIKEPS